MFLYLLQHTQSPLTIIHRTLRVPYAETIVSVTAGMVVNPVAEFTYTGSADWEFPIYPRDDSFWKYFSASMWFGIVPVTFSVSGKVSELERLCVLQVRFSYT